MKAFSVLSALVFAHAAFAQASGSASSSSTAVATGTGTPSTPAPSSDSSASTPTSGSSSPTEAASTTSTGAKSAGNSSAPATPSAIASKPAPSGSSTWEDGVQTITSADGNPLIPDGISTTCSTFLNQLNKDPALASCMAPMITTLSLFSTSGSGSSADVPKTLEKFCANKGCSSLIRAKLTDMNNACADEISTNKMVQRNYDTFFTLVPFMSAMCARDASTQQYCLLGAGSGEKSKRSVSRSSDVLYARDHLISAFTKRAASQTVLVPNVDTYRNSNLLYLFTSPDMNAGDLCTSCPQQILGEYIAFEAGTPHALGMANSPFLGGQSALWKAMKDKCPADFMAAVNSDANAVNSMNGAPSVTAGSGMLTAVAGALAALVALV